MAQVTDRPDGFTLPGVVSVTSAALAQAGTSARELGPLGPDSAWIVGFSFAGGRTVQAAGSGDRREMGPGIDLAAFERALVPPEVIHRGNDLDDVIQVPSAVWSASREHTIDVDPGAFGGFALR